MRVAFDVSVLGCAPTRGLARVVTSVIEALERRAVLDVVRCAPPLGTALRRWRQRELPRLSSATAGVHSFTSAFPLFARGTRVQTVHELPWKHGVRENADLAHRFWASLGATRATRIVVPSEHVARALPAYLRRKVRVVPWGVEARFAPESPPMVVDESVLTRYRLGTDPFVFAPGAVRAKKNLAALLYGLADRQQNGGAPLRVLVTGGDSPQLRGDLGLAARLGLERAVMAVDEIAEADLPSLYRMASAVSVLSHSEGFGLPVLEALASGTPVLVPRVSAQAEVAGAAGIEVEPGSPSSVARGLAQALAERAARRARATARAREFNWERTAEHIEELWQETA
jgi:alpha-1,3-rhamnosyl/mannosyltransferase